MSHVYLNKYINESGQLVLLQSNIDESHIVNKHMTIRLAGSSHYEHTQYLY